MKEVKLIPKTSNQNLSPMGIEAIHHRKKRIEDVINRNKATKIVDRLYPFKIFCVVLLVLALLWSATTEFIFLTAVFSKMWSSTILTIGLTVLILLILELSKYFLGTYFFKYLTHGWLREGHYYQTSFLVILIASAAIYYGSFFLSVNGARVSARFTYLQSHELGLIDTDSINRAYDRKLAVVQQNIEKAQNTTWKGITTRSATELIGQYQEQIVQFETQRDSSLAKAERLNTAVIGDSQGEIDITGYWLARFGGAGELLTLVCLFLLESYYRASYLQMPESLEEEKPESSVQRLVAQDEPKYILAGIQPSTSSNIDPDKVDVRYNKTRSKQCLKRYYNAKSTESKQHNLKVMKECVEALASVGIRTEVDPEDSMNLIFS